MQNKINSGKLLVLTGARKVGKTYLIFHYLKNLNEKYLLLNGEVFDVHELLKIRRIQHYKNILGEFNLLLINEVQKIPATWKSAHPDSEYQQINNQNYLNWV